MAASVTPALVHSKTLVRWFTRYSRRYVRKHFHSVRVLKSHSLSAGFADLPVAVFANHASWWDPLIFLLLTEKHFPARAAFGPMDADALRRYKFLSKLGFFPVERNDARDAVAFLRTAAEVLASPARILWLTPQGQFADVRARPVSIQRGLAHLAARVAPAVFLPLAIEYTFWEERSPEILLAWGPPIFTANHRDGCGVDDWTIAIEMALQETQEALAVAAQQRRSEEWEKLFHGRTGTTRAYDSWRWIRARVTGQTFSKRHSDL